MTLAEGLARRQGDALGTMPVVLAEMPVSTVPLVALSLTGVPALRALVAGEAAAAPPGPVVADGDPSPLPGLGPLVDELAAAGHGAVLVMGKGGVGKTTIAAAIAVGLARRGHDVHLSTTDPAGRVSDVLADEHDGHLTISRIDPVRELERYTAERLQSAQRLNPDRRVLVEEDLRSPCTEELAVFRAFSGLLSEARDRFVVVDTAPSGHTLRLLDLTGSYHRQVMSSADEVHGRITTPLMRLQDPEYTHVVIVTLPELTPVSEAAALQDDLARAGITPFGWVVNAGLTASGTADPLLRARAELERPQLERMREDLAQRAWLVPWQAEGLVGEQQLAALSGVR
ncbi:hypothetical protein LRS13_13100 [Svornostia abyssi]|uniref:AAA+ ATPase domain-containing protein n=1 Tax=Svornostia abyssi TaxID=2898438 RepID=A0ABY5PAE6_9ACTN|nr:hypothetical protein LRS13_13100 [Parviterribacteraceae bacterium J379]